MANAPSMKILTLVHLSLEVAPMDGLVTGLYIERHARAVAVLGKPIRKGGKLKGCLGCLAVLVADAG